MICGLATFDWKQFSDTFRRNTENTHEENRPPEANVFSTVPAGYDREGILEKMWVGQLLAKAKGKHIGRPAGLNAEKFTRVRKALEQGLSVAGTVGSTGINMSSVNRYRKQLGNTANVTVLYQTAKLSIAAAVAGRR